MASDNSTTQYTYDDADRLSSVVYKNDQGVNVSKSTYGYDGLSRLRIITKYTWDTGTSAWVQQSEKKMLYDGMQVIQERDDSDNVIANDIWDGNIGGLEARVVYDINTPANPPQKYFYHYDGSGNVTAVTDDTQSTVASYDYDAYGNQLNASGAYALQNPWRFSTKYYDGGSGLYYYGYRFYSPGLGRWINRDPITESGGLNVYGFVNNDPTNTADAYGLWGVQFGSSCSPIGIGHGAPSLIFSGDDEIEGAKALSDFLNPFGDPYADAGGYNASDPVFTGTRILGAGGAAAGVAAAGVAAVGAVGVGGVATGTTAAGMAAEENPETQEAVAGGMRAAAGGIDQALKDCQRSFKPAPLIAL